MDIVGLGDGSVNGITKNTRANNAPSTQRNHLDALKGKYPNVNVAIASFETDAQSTSYMMGTGGNHNIAIAPNIAELIAKDPDVAAKYENVFAEVMKFDDEVARLEADGNTKIYGTGAVIDKDGKTRYWMVGGETKPRESPGDRQKVMQKQLEERRAEQREEALQEKKRLEKAETLKKLREKMNGTSEADESGLDVTA